MSAGSLDRRVRFERLFETRDDMGGLAEDCWRPVLLLSAERLDISDGERFAAGELSASLGTRWRIRSSIKARSLTAKDRLIFDGQSFQISGIKETRHGRRRFLEITTATRND